MKVLNVVRANTPVSDALTDDPILQSGQDNIRSFIENNLPTDFFLYFIKLGDKHCTRFGYGGAFNTKEGVLHGAPDHVMNRIKEGTAKIVLSWPLESFVEDSIFLEIHEYFKFYNVPLTSIIYLNCCPNGKKIYESFCQRNKIDDDRITMEYIPWYLYDKSHSTPPYKLGKRAKTFFSMNRRMHEHRCLMVSLMNKENLLDNFYMSFPKHHVGTNETFMQKAGGYLPMFSLYGITADDIQNLDYKLPMVLDVSNWTRYPLPVTSTKLSRFYENSFISIVPETFFFSGVIHLTEKTFKPIINHHPFIMVSAPHTLKAIRAFGFKTFGNIIDESYDDIENHYERFQAILNIIRDMSTWSKKKISKTTNEIKEIVDYNYDLLHSRPREELNSFVENYGVE